MRGPRGQRGERGPVGPVGPGRPAQDGSAQEEPAEQAPGPGDGDLAFGTEEVAEQVPEQVRIVVAEDDPAVNELLCLLLRDAGYDVLSTVDGQTALAVSESFAPAALVLDLQMAILDGWQVGSALQARLKRTGSRPKILVVTAGWRAKDAAEEIGADGYCLKPFKNSELLSEVARVLALPAPQPG